MKRHIAQESAGDGECSHTGVPEYGEIRQPGVTACTRIKKAAIRLSVKRGMQPVLTGRAYPQREMAACAGIRHNELPFSGGAGSPPHPGKANIPARQGNTERGQGSDKDEEG